MFRRVLDWYRACEFPPGLYSGPRALLFPFDALAAVLSKQSYGMYRLWDGWMEVTKNFYPVAAVRDSQANVYDQELEQLQVNGYAVRAAALEPAMLQEAQRYVAQLYTNCLVEYEKRRPTGETPDLNWTTLEGVRVSVSISQGRYRFYFPTTGADFLRLPASIRQFIELGEVERLATLYFGSRVYGCRPYCMAEIMPAMGRVESWHVDCSRRGVKAMLYLSDVGGAQAPFRYLPGTHIPSRELARQIFRVGKLGLSASRFSEFENGRFDEAAKSFTAPANTMIVFDTRGIHAGSACITGTRIVLVNSFRPVSSVRVNARLIPPC